MVSPLLFVMSVLITLLSWTSLAKASEPEVMGLSFALPPTSQQIAAGSAHSESAQIETAEPEVVEGGAIAAELPPLNRQSEPLPPITSAPAESIAASSAESISPATAKASDSLALHFDKDTVQLRADNLATDKLTENNLAADNQASNTPATSAQSTETLPVAVVPDVVVPDISEKEDFSSDLSALFNGGGDSLVARTVGSAEGTRLWNGGRTQAYYGHVDPGNGVWNLGTFSYQHEALTPEEADQKQLQRLKSQGAQLEQQAAGIGIQLSLAERLNGLDLANQAPLAALDQGGYIERLAEARRQGKTGNEAIIWARTHAYIDPATQLWNAPGLGNTGHSIERDQARRVLAVEKALNAYDGHLDLAKMPSTADSQATHPANIHAEEDFWAAAPTILDNAEGALMIAEDGALFRNDQGNNQKNDPNAIDQPPAATALSAQPSLAEDSAQRGSGDISDHDITHSIENSPENSPENVANVSEASGSDLDANDVAETDIGLVIPPISDEVADEAALATADERPSDLTHPPAAVVSAEPLESILEAAPQPDIATISNENLPIPAPLTVNQPASQPKAMQKEQPRTPLSFWRTEDRIVQPQ
jgi:hypothetical protein